MSKIKRAAVAGASALGLTVAAFAMAAPASAVVVTYYCHIPPDYPPDHTEVEAEYTTTSSSVTLEADVSALGAPNGTDVTAVASWTSGPTYDDLEGTVVGGGIVLQQTSGVSSPPSGAPDEVELTVPNLLTPDPDDNLVIACHLSPPPD